MKDKPPETAADALRALHELLLEPEPDFASMPLDQVREYLKAAGVDPSRIVREVQQQVAEARGQRRLDEARRQRERLKATVAPKGSSSKLEATFDEVMAEVRRFVGPEQAQVYARRYERQDAEDLESLLEDLEALRALRGPNGTK